MNIKAKISDRVNDRIWDFYVETNVDFKLLMKIEAALWFTNQSQVGQQVQDHVSDQFVEELDNA